MHVPRIAAVRKHSVRPPPIEAAVRVEDNATHCRSCHLLSNDGIFEKLQYFWLFHSLEMPKAELPVAVAPPSVHLPEGGLSNAVLHSATELNDLFSDRQARKLYPFESKRNAIDENKRFPKGLPLLARRVLPIESRIPNDKRLLILHLNDGEIIMSMYLLQLSLRYTQTLHSLALTGILNKVLQG